MAYFIELTSTYDRQVLINVDNVTYVEPYHEGSIIHIDVSHLTSSDSYGTLKSVSGGSETIYVKESYQVVKRKLSEI